MSTRNHDYHSRSIAGTSRQTRGQISPSNRFKLNDIVPEDIWRTIFNIVHQDELKECQKILVTPAKGKFMPRQVFTLSQVCRHWRTIATSQPLLWRDVYLWIGLKSPLLLLKVWLRRSGDAELFVTILAYSCHVQTCSDEFRSCLKLLKSTSSRWRTVSFTLGKAAKKEMQTIFFPPNDVVSNPSAKTSPFSLLESISIACCIPTPTGFEGMGKDAFGFVGRFCRALQISPSIIRFGAWQMDHLPNLTYIESSINFQSVTSLTLIRRFLPDLGQLLTTFSRMSQLKHLELDECHCLYGNKPSQRIILPHLESLSVLNMAHHTQIEDIFQSVLLPALTDVIFTPPLHTPSFRDMIDLSNCTIRRFELKANGVFYEYMFYLLAAPAFSHLEALTLEADKISTSQTEFFDLDPAVFDIPKIGKQVTTPVFPTTLKSLTLIGCTSDDGTLARVANSRMKNGSLSYLYAKIPIKNTDAREKDKEAFRALRRSGFDANLEHNPRKVALPVEMKEICDEQWLGVQDSCADEHKAPTLTTKLTKVVQKIVPRPRWIP